MNYYKKDILFYREKEYGFRTDFQQIIQIPNTNHIVLFKNDDWTNLYEASGEKYSFIINDFGGYFKWAKDHKPKNFYEVEIYFDNDDFLPAIPLFDDEKFEVIEHLKKFYNYSSYLFGDPYEFAIISKSIAYELNCGDGVIPICPITTALPMPSHL